MKAVLSRAVDEHHGGNHKAASVLFRQANIPAIRDWVEALWGKENDDVLKLRNVSVQPLVLPKEERDGSRMPNTALRRELIKRDGHVCRYCSSPVITAEQRKKIHLCYPRDVPWGKTNATQHACFQAMWLQYEHIVPYSRGGQTDLENMIISCAPCNYAKSERTLAELDMEDPRNRPIVKSSWDGLEAF